VRRGIVVEVDLDDYRRASGVPPRYHRCVWTGMQGMSHWQCTRCVALHPNRRGVMPTDRVHCTLRQEQTRNLKAHTTHGTGELARKVRQPPAHQAPPATTEHRPAHSPTWWQRGPTPAHVNPPGDNIGTPAQPPVDGFRSAQVGSYLEQMRTTNTRPQELH